MFALPGELHVAHDSNALYAGLGQALTGAAARAVSERGVFHLALSGGSTPEPFYRILATDPRYRAMPWAQIHVWIVDDRRVPETHGKSNVRMIRACLAVPGTTRLAAIHAIPVQTKDPAGVYEASLSREIGGAGWPPRLDFVVLGMGADCHTASLFPNSAAVQVNDRLMAANGGRNVTPPERVTMTFPLLNAAREVAVLCVGAGKTAALKRVAALDKPDPLRVPVSGIDPVGGRLSWYLDRAATGQA